MILKQNSPIEPTNLKMEKLDQTKQKQKEVSETVGLLKKIICVIGAQEEDKMHEVENIKEIMT